MAKKRFDKGAHERQVFRAFLHASGLAFDLRSVRSGREPRPDIACTMDRERWAIEVTRVVHAGMADAIGNLLARTARTGIGQVGRADTYDDRMALRESIERKRGKTYPAGVGRPALLLYFDGVFHPNRMPPQWAQAVVAEELQGHPDHWRAIWVFDLPRQLILAST